MPIAQDSLFHTVCIDDQKRDQMYPTSLFSIVGMRFKIYPSGLIPFAQSTLFKFIRLLINTPHLRGHVKQLHISLTPNRYSDDRDAAMYKVVEDLAALFQAEQDSLSSSAATGKNSKKTAFSRFAAWLGRWVSSGESETAMSERQLTFWLSILLALLPKLQCLRLWDIHAGLRKFESLADLRRVTECLPSLINSTLLYSPARFEMLRYISLPVYGTGDLEILMSLPNINTADICILRGRSAHSRGTSTKKISHVANLRFSYSDVYSRPEDFLQALTRVSEGFANVRSFELYDGMGVHRHLYPYQDDLLHVFSVLVPALLPHRDTLEALLFSTTFEQKDHWYSAFPDLTAFHRLKTLKIPEQLISQSVRNVINGQLVSTATAEADMWLSPSLKIEHFPPNLELLTIDRCSRVIYHYLKTLIEYENMAAKLCRVDLIVICRDGLDTFDVYVGPDGQWKGHYKSHWEGRWTTPEGSKIKFRMFKDYHQHNPMAALGL